MATELLGGVQLRWLLGECWVGFVWFASALGASGVGLRGKIVFRNTAAKKRPKETSQK